MRYRLELCLPCILSFLAVGCEAEDAVPREPFLWVGAEQYFDAKCWGAKDLSNTPTTVPLRLFVNRRDSLAYVAFASQNCVINAYDLEMHEVPRRANVRDSITPFRVVSWSELAKTAFAADIQVQQVRTPPVHGLSVGPETEIYDGSVDVLGSTLREPQLVSDFAIGKVSNLRRRTDLEPIIGRLSE